MFCKNCGREINDSKFCMYCGTRQENDIALTLETKEQSDILEKAVEKKQKNKNKSKNIKGILFVCVLLGILIFIGIMNFANTRISDIMLRQWECKILERVGMTKKQEYRMFVTEGLFYWLLLCGLLMSFGNLGIGIMQWYMKMQISYFAFRYPVKEMIALMVFLLLFSIIFPGIIYKKLKKKRK